MTMVQTTPILAGIAATIYILMRAVSAGSLGRSAWVIPAGLAVAFALWTTLAILQEGPTGFWPEHIRNLWGNQIWFDLLLAACVAMTVLLPRARALGMSVILWAIFVIATGSVGILSMLARIWFLESRET
jgi:hypothetical protein